MCKSGNFTYCGFSEHYGFTEHGATAEYTKQRARKLHKLPDGLSWEEGALVEPFTIAYFGLHLQGAADAGETVLVFGGGTIGACAVAAAHCMGATVICAEPLPQRRELARQMGADHVLDPTHADFLARVETDRWGGGGLRAGGLRKQRRAADDHSCCAQQRPDHVHRYQHRESISCGDGPRSKQRTTDIKGAVGSPYVWARALKFMQKAKPNLRAMVTHRLPLEQGVEAFRVAKDREKAVKVHIHMSSILDCRFSTDRRGEVSPPLTCLASNPQAEAGYLTSKSGILGCGSRSSETSARYEPTA